MKEIFAWFTFFNQRLYKIKMAIKNGTKIKYKKGIKIKLIS